jgi:hypothetical protein
MMQGCDPKINDRTAEVLRQSRAPVTANASDAGGDWRHSAWAPVTRGNTPRAPIAPTSSTSHKRRLDGRVRRLADVRGFRQCSALDAVSVRRVGHHPAAEATILA